MARPGDVIENPVTGQRLTFLTTEDELFRAEGAFPPGGFAGVVHVHPHQDEHFEVLAGDAAFVVAGEERVLGAGATIDVPAGTPHTFRNAGADEMRVVFEFRPGRVGAIPTERFYELYFAFAQEGRVDGEALPDLLDLALIWPVASRHAVLARPPAWVQGALFTALRPVARAARRRLPECRVAGRAAI